MEKWSGYDPIDVENGKRLVDANALIEKKRKICTGHGEYDYVVDLWNIEHAPTVDAVEVVHGRWLSAYEYALKLGVTDKEKLEETKKDKWWKFCNDCEQPVKGFHNYCPNCGAKMDGDGNG